MKILIDYLFNWHIVEISSAVGWAVIFSVVVLVLGKMTHVAFLDETIERPDIDV